MARITFNEAGKELESAVRFAIGNLTFNLEKDGELKTDDPAVIAGANAHPYLDVELDKPAEGESPEEVAKKVAESDDPHINPRADHLSPVADPEVVKAAQERNAEIQAEVQANAPEHQASEAESPEPQPADKTSAAPTPPATQSTPPATAAQTQTTPERTN